MFVTVALADDFIDFLTLPAYARVITVVTVGVVAVASGRRPSEGGFRP